jgi:hypothetical protein
MPARRPQATSRTHRGLRERNARSQAAQRIADRALLRGSLVTMQRTCGKKGCRCQQGQKHPALYLAIRSGSRRTMIYIPAALEDTARRWVETGHEVEELLKIVSEECLKTFLVRKETFVRKRKEELP